VAALERAVALAQVDGVAVAVAEDLEFDVARVAEILLDIDVASPNAAFASLPACCISVSSWSALLHTFMPRPPPPDAALMITG
jgi:hypothetical protein